MRSFSAITPASAFFGPWDSANFLTRTLNELAAKHRVLAANDQVVSPTYVPDLVHNSLDLLIDGEQGIWHLANRGSITWLDLARQVARIAGLDTTLLEGCSSPAAGQVALRHAIVCWAVSEEAYFHPSMTHFLATFKNVRLYIANERNKSLRI
jgi:dTDP-4-dehydrorhamnose reductase